MTMVASAALPRLLSAAEVADVLRVSRRQVYKWELTGELPVVRLGRRRVFAEGDIAAFIARNRCSGGRHDAPLLAIKTATGG